MSTFDQVLPELLRLCHSHAADSQVRRYCVIRDVRGRVRLAVEPADGALDVGGLEDALAGALGAYFVRPVLSTQGGGHVAGRLAAELFRTASARDEGWPRDWPRTWRNVLGGGETSIEIGTRWVGVERTIGKDAWLGTGTPPWPLHPGQTPPIITFHSFKGGVGRTTLVAAYAIQLAATPPARRVAVIDLDLEAPGVGTVLGVQTGRGVLDVLVDHIATGAIDLSDAEAPARLDFAEDAQITVFPAGSLSGAYLQKLARLDFAAVEPGHRTEASPVGRALTAMLKTIRARFDVILLDARAGLHDLSGMSLHGLAHLDVLVFRGSEQHLAGLAETLRTLGARDNLLLVETLLPAPEDEAARRHAPTRERVYDLLCRYVYPDDEPPQLADRGAPHDVVTVLRREWLEAVDSLRGLVHEVRTDRGLRDLAARLDALWQMDDASGEPDDTSGDEEPA